MFIGCVAQGRTKKPPFQVIDWNGGMGVPPVKLISVNLNLLDVTIGA